MAARLTERDVAVLGDLARLRLACARQIERLHFTGGTALANARYCRRVLARLTDLGLVCRLDRRVGGVRAGSAGFVYALDALGQHLITGTGPAGGQIRRPWTPGTAFVRHRLATSELYVRLIEAERVGHVELVRFEAEPDAWRRYSGAGGGVARVKPDAFAVVAAGDYEHAWFIEVDLATESPTALARKCEAYRQYRASGREQAHTGLFPLVVFLVPDLGRSRVVQAVTERQAPEDRRLFRVGLLNEAARVLAGGAR